MQWQKAIKPSREQEGRRKKEAKLHLSFVRFTRPSVRSLIRLLVRSFPEVSFPTSFPLCRKTVSVLGTAAVESRRRRRRRERRGRRRELIEQVLSVAEETTPRHWRSLGLALGFGTEEVRSKTRIIGSFPRNYSSLSGIWKMNVMADNLSSSAELMTKGTSASLAARVLALALVHVPAPPLPQSVQLTSLEFLFISAGIWQHSTRMST